MDLLLNIGVAREGQEDNTVKIILCYLARVGAVKAHNVQESDTETTVVAVVRFPESNARALNNVYRLASRLGQDCIAAYDQSTGNGYLLGPGAEAWGAFNPEFFLMLDGTRLPSPLQVAA